MRVGYAYLGRSLRLDGRESGNGEVEAIRLLRRLATLHPDWELRVVGRHTGWGAVDLPNVTSGWADLDVKLMTEVESREIETQLAYVDRWRDAVLPMWEDLDASIVWLGQQCSMMRPGPKVDSDGWVKPQMMCTNYGWYVTEAIRHKLGGRRAWLCGDPRNYVKARDIHEPPPVVLSQWDGHRSTKFERWDDPTPPPEGYRWHKDTSIWVGKLRYEYAGVELEALPPPSAWPREPWERDARGFGVVMNETRPGGRAGRSRLVREWGLERVPIVGKWSDKGWREAGFEDAPTYLSYERMWSWIASKRSTLCLPPSGTDWATAKAWEAMLSGVVPFMHPRYDAGGWILRDAPEELRDWLRVANVDELRTRVRHLERDDATWRALARACYEHAWRRRCAEQARRRVEEEVLGV